MDWDWKLVAVLGLFVGFGIPLLYEIGLMLR